MLGIADLADGCVAILVDLADLARGQSDLRVTFIARHQRRRAARRTNHLSAPTRRQLDVMDGQPDGDGLERK